MKRFAVLVTVLAVGLLVLPPSGMGQSPDRGTRLWNEAWSLQQKARSKSDLEQAIVKYQEALRSFNNEGRRQGIARVTNNIGLVYQDLANYEKAIEFYQEALSLARTIGDRACEGWALNNLGEICRLKAQYDKAIDFYGKSMAVTRSIGDRKMVGRTLNNMGLVYKNWGKYKKAVELYEQSMVISRSIKDRQMVGRALNNMGLVYQDWGKYDKAVEFYEQAMTICKRIGDQQMVGRALNNLGEVYRLTAQYDKAIELYGKSLNVSKTIGDQQMVGRTFNNMGLVYEDWGRYDKAVESYEQSIAISKSIGDQQMVGRTLNNVGEVYRLIAQYDKAIELYKKSMNVSKTIGDQQMVGRILNNMALVYHNWGQYDKAVALHEQSMAIAKGIGDQQMVGRALNNMGLVYQDWGQYDKAVVSYEQSITVAKGIGDQQMVGKTFMNLGRVHQHRRQFAAALEDFRRGLKIYSQIKIPTDWPNNLIANLFLDQGDVSNAEPLVRQSGYSSTRARFYLLKSEYLQAKEYYEQLRQSAEMSRSADNLFTVYTGLGVVYEGLGNDAEAEKLFRQAIELTEELRSSLSSAEREKFFDVRIGGFYRTAPYEGLARVLMRINKPIEALKSSEYTRARMFAESMTRLSDGQAFDVPDNVLKKDRELTDRLAALKKSREQAYEQGNKLQIQALEPQIQDLERQLNVHKNMLREKYPLFAATKYPEPMDLSQTALRDDEWVLSFDVTDPGVIVYLTKGKKLVTASFKPIRRKELNKLVMRFLEPLTIKGDEDVSEKISGFDCTLGKKLSDILLADILPKLPQGAPLIVVPDDSLGVLPFEMLVLNNGGKVFSKEGIPEVTGADFFCDRNPISYYQSITALTLVRTLGREKKKLDKLLVMDDPIFDSSDERLRRMSRAMQKKASDSLPANLMSIKNELRIEFPRLELTGALGKSLKRTNPRITDEYEGLEAAKARLFKLPLKDYGAMVFATHGYFGKDLPGVMEPVLVLTLVDQPAGTDGFLRMSEVMSKLRLNADVVALTACQSGIGQRISGEGAMSMGRAFQYAGAQSVLMSLWSVAESSSVDLVRSFFRHLEEGKPKLEALQLARTEIRKQGYDHPFFWAPFILAGEPR
jgi:tetratricopeptide (TPR) repeat protein